MYEGSLFKICVLSQCIVYGIHFQDTHIFTYQKTILHTFFCLFLKSLFKPSVYRWSYKFALEMDKKINIKNVKTEEYHLVI